MLCIPAQDKTWKGERERVGEKERLGEFNAKVPLNSFGFMVVALVLRNGMQPMPQSSISNDLSISAPVSFRYWTNTEFTKSEAVTFSTTGLIMWGIFKCLAHCSNHSKLCNGKFYCHYIWPFVSSSRLLKYSSMTFFRNQKKGYTGWLLRVKGFGRSSLKDNVHMCVNITQKCRKFSIPLPKFVV